MDASGVIRRRRPRIAAAGAAAGSGSGSAVAPAHAPGRFTMASAGDVHFSGRVRNRLDANPATVLGPAAAVLRRADLTMVNLETAITDGGQQQNEEYTFRAPPAGVLTLSFDRSRVVAARFAPSHLDDRGVPVPATGAERRRIAAEGRTDRGCTDLAAHPPS